jgi:hypothetical protein
MGTAIEAILNSSGTGILVSDQTGDVVHQFALDGTYLGVFAPAGGPDTSILNNVRGIAIRPDGNLLVANSDATNPDAVAMFSTTGAFLGNFVANGAGGLNGPFDVFGRTSDWLVSASDSDQIHRYDLTGAFISNLAPVNNFPEQVNGAASGNVLVADFLGTQSGIVEYTADGNLVGNYNVVTGARGVYELGNGNILMTAGTAIHEINRANTLVETKLTGATSRYLNLAVVAGPGCSSPSDVPWLSVAPPNGTTGPV